MYSVFREFGCILYNFFTAQIENLISSSYTASYAARNHFLFIYFLLCNAIHFLVLGQSNQKLCRSAFTPMHVEKLHQTVLQNQLV